MITQDLNTLKFNLMSNEKFEEKQANESLVENEIYLTPAPKVDNEPTENSKNLITSGGVFEALKNVPKDEVKPQIQSDWSQTDETAVDYIKNKIGSGENTEILYQEFDFSNANQTEIEPTFNLKMFLYYSSIWSKTGNFIGKLINKTTNEIIDLGRVELQNGEFDGTKTIEGSFNTFITFSELANAEGQLQVKRINDSIPAVIFVTMSNEQVTNIIIDSTDFDENYKLELYEIESSLIGLPDNILGEEFENIDGVLTSTYGKTITNIIEDKKEYTTKEIGNPNATNPFPRWERICTIENQEFSEDTLVNICYTDIDEQNIQFSIKTLLNATLDEMFGFDPEEYLGYWGIVNSQQTIQEILSLGQWDKIDTSKPSIVIIVQKSLSDGTLYISFAAPELISQYATIYNIEFVNTTIEEHTIKLPTSAIPTDSQPTENSDNFLTSGTINELLNNFQGGGGVQSDWEQEDEAEMDYIKNKPFYALDPVSFEPPRKFYYSWDGEDYADRIYVNIGGYYKISDDVISLEDLHDTIVTIQVSNGIETQILEMKQCDIWEIVSENGDIGYEIAYKASDNGLPLEHINIIPAPGTYISPNGIEQGPYPEAGIYFQGTGSPEIEAEYGVYFALLTKEFKGPIDETQFTENDWYYKDGEDIIYLKQINTEPLTESDWFGANISYKYYNYIAEYNTIPVEEIYNVTSRVFAPTEFIIVVKNNETIDNPWISEEKLTLQKGTYAYGDTNYQLVNYQLMKKLDKKFVPQDIAYNKIEQGNTKAVSSGAVYEALGGYRVYKTSSLENSEEKLMTAKGVYDIVQTVEQELNKKQNSLEILDSVQENSDGIVKSSGIYNAIAAAVPTDVGDLGNSVGYQNASDVQAAIQNNITSELSSTNNSAITSSAVHSALSDVMAAANGKRTSHVFNTKAELDNALNDSDFVADLQPGDTLLIKESNSPDYWWDGTELVELETKIDLTEYYTKSEVQTNYYDQSVIDNKLSTKKDNDRITLKGNPQANGYYLFGRLPYQNNSGNWASYILKGRMGGWQSDNSAYFEIMLMNRNGIVSTVSAQTTSNDINSALNLFDIIVISDTSKPDPESNTYPAYIYLKGSGYFACDFEYLICGNSSESDPEKNIEVLYDGTVAFTEEPSDIIWKLSTASKTVTYPNGSFSPSGGLDGLFFKKAYSSQISNPVEGTIYYNTSNKTIQVYSGGSWSSAVAADPNTIYFVVEG